jgi:dihydrofolate reductase
LKREDGGDLCAIDSTQLVAALLEHDLVDGYRLMIDPLALAVGRASSATTACSERSASSRAR